MLLSMSWCSLIAMRRGQMYCLCALRGWYLSMALLCAQWQRVWAPWRSVRPRCVSNMGTFSLRPRTLSLCHFDDSTLSATFHTAEERSNERSTPKYSGRHWELCVVTHNTKTKITHNKMIKGAPVTRSARDLWPVHHWHICARARARHRDLKFLGA